jgi:hypothetical protein
MTATSRRVYLIGGSTAGQLLQGFAGALYHTCMALVHLQRLHQREVTPGLANGVLQSRHTRKRGTNHARDGKTKFVHDKKSAPALGKKINQRKQINNKNLCRGDHESETTIFFR